MFKRCAFILLLCTLPAALFAHTPLPAAQGLHFVDGPGSLPYVWTNTGIMLPDPGGIVSDGGQQWMLSPGEDWWWICEDVAGLDVLATAFVLSQSGHWMMGTGSGLYISEDGCDWQAHPDFPAGVLDVSALELSGDQVIMALASPMDPEQGTLFLSNDGGRSFEPLWPQVFGADVGILAFVSGADNLPILVGVEAEFGAAYLWRSGDEWVDYLLPESEGVQILPYAYLEDGGKGMAFVALRSGEGDVLAKAHPDGRLEQVLDFRGASDFLKAVETSQAPGLIWTGSKNSGLFVSDDLGETWALEDGDNQVLCLAWSAGSLYQCADNWVDLGVVLRRSPQTDVESIMDFGLVRGPIECPADSAVGRVCDAQWESLKLYGMNQASDLPDSYGNSGEDEPIFGCAHSPRPQEVELGLLLTALLFSVRRRGLFGNSP